MFVWLSGCVSLKPVELPQYPYPYDSSKSMALNYANATGIYAMDLSKGEAEELLKERQKSVIESGLSASLSGYVLSFAFASALGLPPTVANGLAKDSAKDHFILGTGTANSSKPLNASFDGVNIYLPYEKAPNKESARVYVFNYFMSLLQSTGMKLEGVEGELKYGVGHEFTHPLCEELDTSCRYQFRIKMPVLAYAPKIMGGYKAWVWSAASNNIASFGIYQVSTWGDLVKFNMSKIKDNELKVQDRFFKPLVKQYPDWSIVFRSATYNDAPQIIVGNKIYRFERPQD